MRGRRESAAVLLQRRSSDALMARSAPSTQNLDARIGRTLKRDGISTPEQLCQLDRRQLRAVPRLGRRLADVVERAIEAGDQQRLRSFFDLAEPSRQQGAVPALTETQRHVLRLRYAADGSVGLTYREIGSRLGVSASRVHQQRTAALDRLGQVARAIRLRQPVRPEAGADLRAFRTLFVRWWNRTLP